MDAAKATGACALVAAALVLGACSGGDAYEPSPPRPEVGDPKGYGRDLLVELSAMLVLDVLRGPTWGLQRDRTTPWRWVDEWCGLGPLKTGAALGIGVTHRIGFPGWHLVPVLTLRELGPA